MAIDIRTITFQDNYIEVIVEGAANVAPYNYEAAYEKIAAACLDYNCLQVLIDRTAVEGLATVGLQQVVAQYIARTFPAGVRIALLVPDLLSPHRLEAAVASHGKTLKLFWDRDNALKWLLKK
jgi:hypothetical protein